METRLVTKEEKEEMLVKNQGLVKYHANSFLKRIGLSESEFDDLVSYGMMGLMKAIETYDISAESRFGTYASVCIKNGMKMYLRKERRHRNIFSLDCYISGDDDDDDDEKTLGDTIPGRSNIEEELVNRELSRDAINIILNVLEKKERFVMLYRIAGASQSTIAQVMKYNQSHISRIEKKARKKLKKYMKMGKKCKNIFSVAIQDEIYEISFSTSSVEKFNKTFATLLQTLTLDSFLPDFTIKSGKVILQLPADSSSFIFIAQIIQELDECVLINTV